MKPVFLLYNAGEDGSPKIKDYFEVMLHGLPLDLSTAGYLTAFPLLLMLVSCFVWYPFMKCVLRVYYAVTAFLLSVILCVDCALYSFWQFKLDATIFNYIDSPAEALASVSPGFVLLGVLATVALAALFFFVLKQVRLPEFHSDKRAWLSLGPLVLLGGILFVFVRGGLGKSTMNIGSAYYSDCQFYNHAAVNPAFSLLASSLKTKDFSKLYRFYDGQECSRLFAEMKYDTRTVRPDSLLNTSRPNVLIILMEGFGATFIEPLGGEPGVTPCFNRLAGEGVLFSQCYANSFRTDRGTVCAFSGYPAFPGFSIMKMPQKSRTLPSIARTLAGAGYTTDFLYGGDINFTNMNSYLLSTGYQTVRGDTHFPSSVRKTHAWGVTDRIVFDTLYNQIVARKQNTPWFTTFLTLASHEPWVVPYHRIKGNERTNAMAYTDDCLGRFVERLKRTPAWKNLLIVCIADHGITYPAGLTEADKRRYHIPMLWIGGAVKRPRVIEKICNQTDLPATLLGQMGLGHKDFSFSRDVTSSTYTRPSAIHTFDDGFSLIDSTGYTVIDFQSGRALTDLPHPSQQRKAFGQAFLQTAIDDFAKR